MITYPFLLIIIISTGITFSFPLLINQIILLPFLLPLGLLLGLLYRAFAIPKWRIWAFANVRNVHELSRRAAYAGLIFEEGNKFLSKMEIWSAADKAQWEQLQVRFQTADIFIEDPDVPAETIVYFSKAAKLFFIFLGLLSVSFGLLLIFLPQTKPFSAGSIWGYCWGAFLILSMGYFTYINAKDLFNNKPQLTINNEGIECVNTRFTSWADVRDIDIVVRGSGKSRSLHLVYRHSYGTTDLHLDGFNMSRKELDKRIGIYRGRFARRQTRPGSSTALF
ncbi:STM3941 family protein [Chitinophaga arvensicola]|uniref:Uncharacterized protein n=1 Tax=Chitinophaga arvensicola TaxID=29529 RepID=A0A1I0RVY9_9BACT|nr:STM3941 family protein [Chitinophaga arvensicola]SEW45598.1 hypothetical protein SAMN04488122_3487 [Chitinophaga arvensicola]